MMLDFKSLFDKYHIKTDGVLHCGASFAQEAELYHSLGINKMIFIEAIPKVYEQMIINIGKYPNAIGINECLSDVDGQEVTFNISNNESQSSSFLELGHHKIIHPSVVYVDKLTLTTKRVDTIVKEYGIDLTGIKFINLDLQGVEYQCLVGMGELLNNFNYAIIEINKKETYIHGVLVDKVDGYMSCFGFERVETGDWVGDTWTDGFYIKKNFKDKDGIEIKMPWFNSPTI